MNHDIQQPERAIWWCVFVFCISHWWCDVMTLTQLILHGACTMQYSKGLL